tara:strand:+ start:3805 stop:4800 length:996 start_codon:yes stop_codon:yes gene_type:complete
MQGINVLSLFDGMSCAMLALEKLGIPVKNYYASEIDKFAIKVSKKNYPNIIQLGDVTNWREWDLPGIDLIIGGSPCQGFSNAGKRLNFDDPRSKLFFEFVDIVNHYNPKYFLLENVRMKEEHRKVITDYMKVEPIMINSALVSAQNRVRYYWTNIPAVKQPKDKGIALSDIIEINPENYTIMSDNFTKRNKNVGCLIDSSKKKASNLSALEYVKNGRQGDYLLCDVKGAALRNQVTKRGIEAQLNIRKDTKSNCVVPSWPHKLNGCVEYFRAFEEPKYRKLTPIECERLQTVPDNYTDSVSNTQRYKMLGNGFTVDVIAHILSYGYYSLRD